MSLHTSMNSPNVSLKSLLQTHRSIRTLLVDDSDIMRDYLTILIGHECGLELVGTATNGRQTLRSVAALRPDLVLMDVDMPCLDGLQATRSIKESGRQSGYTPVIVILTANDTLECRSQAGEAGADGFVAKSEDLRSQLKSTLARLFAGNRESSPADLIEARSL